MRTKLAIAIALLALGALALGSMAATAYRIPLWDGSRYIWPLLGPSLVVQGGYLDIVLAPTPAPRQRNVVLQWQQIAGGYKFPAAPKNQECHVNGLLYTPGDDYTITGDTLVPGVLGNWPPAAEAKVVCSYDR